MANPAKHRNWISTVHLRANTALALAVLVLGGVATARAQTFTVLYNFAGSPDGANPDGGLVRDKAGNLYGTTPWGGSAGEGTVFKVDAGGIETVLHTFTLNPDGADPTRGSLILDAKGNLYGTTNYGGAFGWGTVFELTNSGVWTEIVLYSFRASPDGAMPQAGLVRDTVGNLYGTTVRGGSVQKGCQSQGAGCGTVFKVDTSGKETLLHVFAGPERKDGANPDAGLSRDAKGNLYGTTTLGGISHSFGTVFKLDTTGKETVLHSFNGMGGDGAYPQASLLKDERGNFYGTTVAGGDNNCHAPFGCGTVYKLSKTGKETVLYRFSGTDGEGSHSALVRDRAGNFYGTTVGGGAYGYGTVFKLSSTGKETVLHSFTGGADGGEPLAGVILDAAGNVYGTTSFGGTGGGDGVVFKLTP